MIDRGFVGAAFPLLLLSLSCLEPAAALESGGECAWRTYSQNESFTSTKLLESELIIDNPGYDPGMRPSVALEGRLDAAADDVEVQFYLISFVLDEMTQTMNARGYLRLRWTDFRLAHCKPADCNGTTEWILNDAVLIWRPDLYGENMRDWSDREPFNSGTWIYPNGDVFDSSYINSFFECKIRVQEMPYDKHVCTIRISSYTLSSNHLRIHAHPSEPVAIKQTMAHNVWSIDGSSADEFRVEYVGVGLYDIVDLKLKFSRKPRYHIFYSMAPAALFLLISWTGFFIDRTCTVAIIPVLTMRLLLNAVFSRIEAVSYGIYLAAYLNIAMYISCICVCEYGIVQILLQKERDAVKRRKTMAKTMQLKQRCQERRSIDGDEEGKVELGAVSTCNTVQLAQPVPLNVSAIEADKDSFEDAESNPVSNHINVAMHKVFDRYAHDGWIDACALSLAMRYHYGVYIDAACTRDTMLTWIYINGLRIPKDQTHLRLNFDQFQDFVIHYDEYDIGRDGDDQTFFSKPASLKTDLVARVAFVPACCLIYVIQYAIWIGWKK